MNGSCADSPIEPVNNAIIAGCSAGGNVRGALNAGLNIIGIEQDQKQYLRKAIIAFYGAPTVAVNYINMPTDPLHCHNIIIGSKMVREPSTSMRKKSTLARSLIISLSGSFVDSPRQATLSLSLALVLVGT